MRHPSALSKIAPPKFRILWFLLVFNFFFYTILRFTSNQLKSGTSRKYGKNWVYTKSPIFHIRSRSWDIADWKCLVHETQFCSRNFVCLYFCLYWLNFHLVFTMKHIIFFSKQCTLSQVPTPRNSWTASNFVHPGQFVLVVCAEERGVMRHPWHTLIRDVIYTLVVGYQEF